MQEMCNTPLCVAHFLHVGLGGISGKGVRGPGERSHAINVQSTVGFCTFIACMFCLDLAPLRFALKNPVRPQKTEPLFSDARIQQQKQKKLEESFNQKPPGRFTTKV